MDLFAFIFFLFGLQLICLMVGKQSSKDLKDQDDYFLAGKNVRFFPLMMTFLATQVGGGMILGSAEEAYRYGWSVLFYPLGISLGLISLGLGLGRMLAQFKVSTVAQIFEAAYGSEKLKKLASILSIISLFMVLAAQVIASNKFMISLGITNPLWSFAFWTIVILYTSMGGLKAVVATDIIQAAFFMVTFFILFGFTYMSSATIQNFESPNFVFDPSKLWGWLLMPFLFMVIEQDMGQRCFAADSPKTVSRATIWAGILAFLASFVSIFMGVIAKKSGIVPEAGSSILITVVMKTTNPILAALVGSAVLAAIISTADSLINAIGSNVSQDFNIALMQKNLRTSQILSASIAGAAFIFSLYFNNVVDLLIQSYELCVSCLFVPIFIVLFKKKGNFLSATLSIAFGAIGFIAFRFFSYDIPKEILSILLSFSGYALGEIFVWVGLERMLTNKDIV